MIKEKNIYICAPNIRHGGGLSLLEMIIKAAQSLDFSIGGNLNSSLKKNEDLIDRESMSFEFTDSGLSNYLFPLLHTKKNIDLENQIILFFGNLPPIYKMKGRSFLYIHSKLLLEPVFRYKLNIKTRIRLIFEKLFIFLFYKNVDLIVVQTPSMMQLSRDIFKKRETICLPFFDYDKGVYNHNGIKQLDFFYPSYGYTYKNHKNLLQAFTLLSERNIFPSIALALDTKIDTELINFITEESEKYNLKIELVLDKNFEQMKDYYNSCKALVWPSFTESLGMPLIEASVNEKDILASDLEYVHDILEIKKEDCFNPNDPLSIADCMENYISRYTQGNKNNKIKLQIYSTNDFLNKLYMHALK